MVGGNDSDASIRRRGDRTLVVTAGITGSGEISTG